MSSELLSNVELIDKNERNNNCNNIKQKFEQDVLETPRIDQFKHENNPFASSFKDEVLKAEFSRHNSLVQSANITGTIDSPLPTVFVHPNELSILPLPLPSSNSYTSTTQGMSSPSSSSLSSTSSSSSSSSSPSNEPYSNYARQLSSQSSLTASVNSNIAPKKSILLRTISKNDNVLDDTKSISNSEHKNSHSILLNRTNSSFNNQIQQAEHYHTPEQQQQQQHHHQDNNIFKFLNMHHNKAEEIDLESVKNKRKYENVIENIDIETESKYSKISEPFLTETNSISSRSNDTPSPYSETTKGTKDEDSRLVKKRRSIALTSETRRQQIRDSNREAARRCRERKRTYIETLELNIRNLEKNQKDLLFENENLRKIVNEHMKTCSLNLNNSQIMNGHANNAKNGQLNNILKRFQETKPISTNENHISNIPVYLAADLNDATTTAMTNLRETNSKTSVMSNANSSNAMLNVNNNSLISKNNLLKDLIETNNLNLITKTNTTTTSLISQSNELSSLTNHQILEKLLEKISNSLHQNTYNFNYNNNLNNSLNPSNTSPNDNKNVQHIESILPSNIN